MSLSHRRPFVAVALIACLVLLAVPRPVFADEEDDMAILCGETDQSQQQVCVAMPIYWTSGGGMLVELSTGEFAAVFVVWTIHWALWRDVILPWMNSFGNVPYCTNCQEGLSGAITANPTEGGL